MSKGIGVAVAVLALSVPGFAEEKTASFGAPPPGETVLDNNSLWRSWLVFKYPDVRKADGTLEARSIHWYWGGLSSKPAPSALRTPLPPADWTRPDFDDLRWPRTRTPVRTFDFWRRLDYDVAVMLLRGKFEVKDPAQIESCTLSLDYHGGAVAYVNGQELAGGHVPGGTAKAAPSAQSQSGAVPSPLETLAEDYPLEAFLTPEGKPMRPDDRNNSDRLALRERHLSGVKIPGALLRKGVNVLALEIHRAPVPEVIAGKGGFIPPQYGWAPIGVRSVHLAASPAGAITPNRRPDGIQVWTGAPDDTVTAFDYGDPNEPLQPISIPAARNGVFSGRLVVSSNQAIKGLKVNVSDLAQAEGGAQIPASAVRVRYAEPAVGGKSWLPAHRFDGLLDAIPAEIPVIAATPPAESYAGQPVDRKDLTPAAVAMLWLSVRVPREAKSGMYEGAVSVSAEALKPTTTPLRVTVHNWDLPDPKDFRIKNFGQLSLETMARYYEVPFWSDRHFELVGKSMALMSEVNSRQVLVDLALDFYGVGGNHQTLVRWVRKPDGTYDHDFSVFDKYLDLVDKAIGKPLPLRLNCWQEWERPGVKAGGKYQWTTPCEVSLLDPVTGKLERLDQPPADTPEFLAFWKPVLDEARRRIEARGWFDVTSVGWNSYCFGPSAIVVDTYKKIWPDGVWSYTAHNGPLGGKFTGTDKSVSMPVRYADTIWGHGRLTARGYRALLKPRPGIWCFTFRGWRAHWDLPYVRGVPESEIMMGHDGVSDFGVDFFPLKRPDGRRYEPVGNGRGTGGPRCSTLAILAPGPDGPIATERFEMFREGVQLSQAILFIEGAIQQKRITGDLEQRANRYLEERGAALVPGWLVDRFAQDERLLALAAEVAGRAASSSSAGDHRQ